MCKIFHQNIRGLSHKIDELMLSLSETNPQVLCITDHHLNSNEMNTMDYGQYTLRAQYCRRLFKPYPTAFPYGNGMVLHFYQQQESSTTKTVHKVINKGLKTYV